MIAGALFAFAFVVAAAPPTKDERLAELRQLLQNDACEQLLAMSHWAEDHRLATRAERHEAMFARGHCLTTLGNISEASSVLVELMFEDAAANPPFAVEPRMEVLIEAARAQVKEARTRARAEERERKIARLQMKLERPEDITGGERAVFLVDLTDPDQAVRSMRIDFRKAGDPEFYGLPIVQQSDGRWRGEIPGTYTRTRLGVSLQWIITASDESGEKLVTVGTREKPENLAIGAGSLIASDVKASERVPQESRLLYAIVTPPLISAFFLVAVDGAIQTGTNLFAADDPDGTGPDNTQAARVFRGILPPLAAAAGTYFATYAILDPTLPQLLPAISTGAVFLVYGVLVMVDENPFINVVGPPVAGQSPQERLNPTNKEAPLDYAQLAVVGAALLTSAAVPAVLVLVDAPVE